jgi:hypothetical protein
MKKTDNKSETIPEPRTHARRKATLISSPTLTVNAVMVWLSERLGVYLPKFPLPGWPSFLLTLWEMLVPGSFPSGPLPWAFSIEENWPAFFPQSGSPPVALENLTIHVQHKSWVSPG